MDAFGPLRESLHGTPSAQTWKQLWPLLQTLPSPDQEGSQAILDYVEAQLENWPDSLRQPPIHALSQLGAGQPLPALRFCRSLELHAPISSDLITLARTPEASSLRRLSLYGPAFGAHFEGLRAVTSSPIFAQGLRELRIDPGGWVVSPTLVRQLEEDWTLELTTLELSEVDLDVVLPLLRSDKLHSLQKLSLRSARANDLLIERLAGAQNLPQLTELTILEEGSKNSRSNHITLRGAQALAQANNFSHTLREHWRQKLGVLTQQAQLIPEAVQQAIEASNDWYGLAATLEAHYQHGVQPEVAQAIVQQLRDRWEPGRRTVGFAWDDYCHVEDCDPPELWIMRYLMGLDGGELLCFVDHLELADGSYLEEPDLSTLLRCEHLWGLHALSLGEDVELEEALEAAFQNKHLSQLRGFRLDGPELGDEGVELLVESPLLANLEELTLACAGLSDEGVRVLAASPALESLKSLDLYANDLEDEGARALLELDEDGELWPQLERLNLGGNEISEELIEELRGWAKARGIELTFPS